MNAVMMRCDAMDYDRQTMQSDAQRDYESRTINNQTTKCGRGAISIQYQKRASQALGVESVNARLDAVPFGFERTMRLR